MIDTLKYSSINAKIKGMYARNLSKEDLEDILKQTRIKDAVIILKAKLDSLKNLSVDVDRIELEEILDSIIIADIKKINKILGEKSEKIFNSYLLKYKINCLKEIWKNFEQEEELKGVKIWVEELFPEMNILLTAKNKDEFINNLKNKTIKKIFEANENIFEIENKLDKYYFLQFYKEAKGKNKILEKMVGNKIDLLNVLWIYRSKRFKQIDTDNILIEINYKLTNKLLKEVKECTSQEDISVVLGKTIYKNVIKNNIESDIKKYLYNKNRKIFRQNSYNMSLIIAYFEMQEIERDNIINLIEGIRYNLDKNELRNKIII